MTAPSRPMRLCAMAVGVSETASCVQAGMSAGSCEISASR